MRPLAPLVAVFLLAACHLIFPFDREDLVSAPDAAQTDGPPVQLDLAFADVAADDAAAPRPDKGDPPLLEQGVQQDHQLTKNDTGLITTDTKVQPVDSGATGLTCKAGTVNCVKNPGGGKLCELTCDAVSGEALKITCINASKSDICSCWVDGKSTQTKPIPPVGVDCVLCDHARKNVCMF